MATSRVRTLLLLQLFTVLITAKTTCFYRDGSSADGDKFIQCPGLKTCCKSGDSCASNGLCIDINNKPDGTTTGLSDGKTYNFSGLYQTATCVNADWSGCQTQCSSPTSHAFAYIWACNAKLTQFCCLGAYSLFTQGSCCADSNQFSLAAASPVPWNANPATVGQSSQSSSVAAGGSGGAAAAAASSNAALSNPSSAVTGSSPSASPSIATLIRPSQASSSTGTSPSSTGVSPSSASSADPSNSASTVASSSPSSTPSAASSTKDGGNSTDGLSTSAKAGVGVGIAAGVLGLLLAALLVFRTVRKRSASPPSYTPAAQYELPIDQGYGTAVTPSDKFITTEYYGGNARRNYVREIKQPHELHADYQRRREELP